MLKFSEEVVHLFSERKSRKTCGKRFAYDCMTAVMIEGITTPGKLERGGGGWG